MYPRLKSVTVNNYWGYEAFLIRFVGNMKENYGNFDSRCYSGIIRD